MRPDVRQAYETNLTRIEQELAQLQAQLPLDRAPRFPTLREQAIAAGVGFEYSLAYRFDSQSAAHPSAMAVEQLMEDRPDLGGVQLLVEPPSDRGYADPYSVAAFILSEALVAAGDLVPELVVDGLREIQARLIELMQQ